MFDRDVAAAFSSFLSGLGDVVVLFVNVVNGPVSGGLSVGLATLVEESVLDEGFLAESSGSEAPAFRVEFSVHDDSLGLGDDSVIAGSELGGGHLSDRNSDGLTLCRDEDDFLADLDVVVVSEYSGKHELSAVTDRVDCRVLDDDSREANEEDLEGENNSSEVALVLEVLESPDSVLNVVHRDEVVVFVEDTRADSSEFFHVRTSSEE